MILNCFWILLKCYQYYSILPILPILHNITNITNITNQRLLTITHYYIMISNIKLLNITLVVFIINMTQNYQYCSILLIQYNSIFLRILTLKTVLFQFNIMMCQYPSILQAIPNVHQYHVHRQVPQYYHDLSNLEMS